jgi:hypothetical protein
MVCINTPLIYLLPISESIGEIDHFWLVEQRAMAWQNRGLLNRFLGCTKLQWQPVVTDTEAILNNTCKLQDDIVASIRPEDTTLGNILLPLATDESNTCVLKRVYNF